MGLCPGSIGVAWGSFHGGFWRCGSGILLGRQNKQGKFECPKGVICVGVTLCTPFLCCFPFSVVSPPSHQPLPPGEMGIYLLSTVDAVVIHDFPLGIVSPTPLRNSSFPSMMVVSRGMNNLQSVSLRTLKCSHFNGSWSMYSNRRKSPGCQPLRCSQSLRDISACGC